MSPTLNGSSALQHFECGNAVELRNGRMFDFYPGLPHLLYIIQSTKAWENIVDCVTDSTVLSSFITVHSITVTVVLVLVTLMAVCPISILVVTFIKRARPKA